MTKHAYNLKAFNDAVIKLQEFVSSEELDMAQCTIDIADGPDGEMYLMCWDRISQRMFSTGVSKEHIQTFNFKKWPPEDSCDTIHAK